MFGFIFQALYSFYERKEKGGDSVWTASLYISVIEYMLFGSFLIMLDIFSNGVASMNGLNVSKEIQAVVILGAGAIIFLCNLRYYRNKKDAIIAKYRTHPANKWFRVWMIGIIMFILLFSPVLWKTLYHLFIV